MLLGGGWVNWFRLYNETIYDRKLRRLPVAHRWLWIAVLTLARQSPEPGHLLIATDVPATLDDIVDAAACETADVQAGLDAFTQQEMLHQENGVYVVTHWNKRQFQTDDVTQRTRQFRERSGNVPETLQERSGERNGNGPEAEAEAEAETDIHTTYAAQEPEEKKPLKAAKTSKSSPREDQVLFAALKQELDYGPRNDIERGKWNKAIKAMRETSPPVLPQEVPRLHYAFRQRFQNATCTPMALASNVGLLRSPPPPQSMPSGQSRGRKVIEDAPATPEFRASEHRN